MSIDARTRLLKDRRLLARDEVFDVVLPEAIARHGDLAARGIAYKELPPLGFSVAGRAATLVGHDGSLRLESGVNAAGVVAELAADALSDLVQDVQSTMGLAMTADVKLTAGNINTWIAWEPALRALFDGRKVHETGDVTFVDLDGGPLDLDRVFTVDDDREEIAHFLEQAGFLHIRGVFEEDEMARVAADIDEWIARATPDDGASWWAETADGVSQAVRVLFFYEKSAALRELVNDARYQWIGDLTGDGHRHRGGAEGLVKPLGIVRGLSDLPWHKDCGQGKHAYSCSGLTCGISVTGADRVSGALGVIPGSHRANTMATGRDPLLDLQPRMLETLTGDVTVHCSDTLHRAHPPVERPRKVVYSGFGLPPIPGDEVTPDPRYSAAARAELSSVQDRIEAADNDGDERRYRARRGLATTSHAVSARSDQQSQQQ
jgi:Phytanoyl-CoA dioxygenase (PhyH)